MVTGVNNIDQQPVNQGQSGMTPSLPDAYQHTEQETEEEEDEEPEEETIPVAAEEHHEQEQDSEYHGQDNVKQNLDNNYPSLDPDMELPAETGN